MMTVTTTCETTRSLSKRPCWLSGTWETTRRWRSETRVRACHHVVSGAVAIALAAGSTAVAAESAAAWTAARGSTHSRTRRRPPAQRSPRPAPGTGAARNERDSQPRPAGRDDRDLEGYVDQRATELGAPADRRREGTSRHGLQRCQLAASAAFGPGRFPAGWQEEKDARAVPVQPVAMADAGHLERDRRVSRKAPSRRSRHWGQSSICTRNPPG
jgi:hypothetical protein